MKHLLERVGMFDFSFQPYPPYHSLVIKFLLTYCLRVQFIVEQIPFNSMRFRLEGKECFLTAQEFDTISGFKQMRITSPNTFWSLHNF